MEIIEINHSIAFRIGNKIYLNKELINYPKLRNAIIKHELEHTDTFKLKDIVLDLQGKYLKSVKKDYYLFILKNPKALFQFLPVMRINNVWTWDIIMLFVWLLFLLMLTIVWSVIR